MRICHRWAIINIVLAVGRDIFLSRNNFKIRFTFYHFFCIEDTNKFWGFFFVSLKMYSEKSVRCIIQSIVIVNYDFSPSFIRQHTDSAFKKVLIFWGDPRIDPIFYFCKKWSAARLSLELSTGTSDTRKEQYAVNTPDGVGHPIEAPLNCL